jgi:hypothetical protein
MEPTLALPKRVSKSQSLVAQFLSTLPSGYDFNQQVNYLHDEIERYCLDQQAVGTTALLDAHYKENMTKGEVGAFGRAATHLEFGNGQKRKATAGNAYQRIILDLLIRQGLNVRSPSKTDFGSSIDLALFRDYEAALAAFLAVKHTLRERVRGELSYQDLARTYNVPIIVVTHDTPTQTLVDELLGYGFDIVLQDHLVSQFKASPHVHAMSRLPVLLRGLSQRFKQAA